MDYVLHILIIACCYTILAVSLDLLAGHTGLLSLAHAAFFGIGAYTSALMTLRTGSPFPVSALVGMTAAALISLIVALPALRLRDDYFVIATFAFGLILFSVFNNCSQVTGGPLGIPGIPHPVLFGWHVETRMDFVVLAASVTIIVCLISWRIAASPFGRVLRAIREDEVITAALGKNVVAFKVKAFFVSSALAALAGSLYAHYVTYINPTSFSVTESILVISMVIIGGAASRWGPVLGAFLLIALPEGLRFVGMPTAIAAPVRQIVYGALLVILMLLRPRGLLGRFTFVR